MALSKSTQRAKENFHHTESIIVKLPFKRMHERKEMSFCPNTHLPNNLKSMITYCQIKSKVMKTNKIKVLFRFQLSNNESNLYSLKLENVNEAQCECICPQTTGRLIKEELSLSHPCLS